jgi:predicted ABC-type transport system involved in lysophospholipase L1 biosynthesis ATPase subunit
MTMHPVLKVAGLTKSFVVHAHGDLALPVLRDVALAISPGECLALVGPSGAGKSTLLRSLYGNYRADTGSIRVHHDNAWTELVGAEPRTVLDVRRRTMGFVSQFLRVIPRVATVDVVAEPLLRLGADPAEARDRAEFLLSLLNIPQRLWPLPPGHLLGRRAAAGQHRALADRRLSDPAARRADRLARCRQPRPRRRADRPAPRCRQRPGRHLPRSRRARAFGQSSLRGFTMSTDQIFTNGRIVTRDAEFDGTVVVRDGQIVEVAPGRAACATAVDLEGDYLVPGLVELHTDNMEKHFAPRPGVQWPSIAAVMAHDTQIAAAGITTVFDSLSLGDVRGDTDRVKNRARMVEAICAGERAPAVARRASPAPALRDHARRRRAGGRPLDRPAAGRPDLDQRSHAGPAPVPRSGQAQAVLHRQVRHDRGAVRGLPGALPRSAQQERRPASPRDRGARPGAGPAARQPRRRDPRACRGSGRERHDHRRVPDHARGRASLARGRSRRSGRRAQPGAGRLALRQHRRHRPSCATGRPTSCRRTMCRRA